MPLPRFPEGPLQRAAIKYGPPVTSLLLSADALFHRLASTPPDFRTAFVELLAVPLVTGVGVIGGSMWERRSAREQQGINILGREMAQVYRDIASVYTISPADETRLQNTASWLRRTAIASAIAETLGEEATMALESPQAANDRQAQQILRRLLQANAVAQDAISHELAFPTGLLTDIPGAGVIAQGDLVARVAEATHIIKTSVRENIGNYTLPDSTEPLSLVTVANAAMERIAAKRQQAAPPQNS
ncbi:MAG: hypothetical protein ACREGI_01270 [Candidatus Levyibacteriota bacterium]